MRSHKRTEPAAEVSRRRMLQALAAVGVTGPLALQVVAQSRGQITIDVLQRAAVIVGQDLSGERLAVVEKALQRNLDQFQLVRDLVIDDRVEPAPIFDAKIGGPSRAAAPRVTSSPAGE